MNSCITCICCTVSILLKKIIMKLKSFYPGLPSQPVILNVSGGSESATITLRVDSFGVLVASDFTFVVSVFSPSDTTNPVAVRIITPDSIDSPIVDYCMLKAFLKGLTCLQ